MSGGGNTTGFGGQGSFGGGQANTQPTQPQFQPNTTSWSQPTFTTDPTQMSPTQNWWTRTPMGASAALNTNLQNKAALPEDQRAGYQDLDAQGALNQTLRNQIQGAMGNYGKMVDYANRTGISTADIQNAIGGNTDMYTYMNRPNYQQYSPNGQFNQPIYQPSYQNYNTGNAMGVSQYGQGNYGAYLPQMGTPFNPYTNSYQTPFSPQQAQPTTGNTLTPAVAQSLMQRSMVGGVPTSEFDRYGGYDTVQAMYNSNGGTYNPPTQQPGLQTPFNYSQQVKIPSYGSAAQTLQTAMTQKPAIVSRSASMRGTPNVVRRAEGGIASLMDSVE